ncbi:hypothetical protein E4M02_01805 [Brevundimonas sp. S30B]|uniref:baseplate multidomain protein megatron n=1 Tax=unclassified Brevundimonas TaxID=2622653 RepID=UPI0010727033|nr:MULTISPECIES: glycoside hydrolase/phage tail family protein [unclassified Brevundimonas]QBX37364.1 hypothetical protein E4M01_06015 [Brevundimonas sp. MF30-B]TFW03843.1 hypothetical protein E4M02_01805 [Brevundimonas sp. S30B]
MAQAVLGGLGGALAGGVGQAVGAALGRVVDNGLVAALAPPQQRGPRLEGLKLQSSAEGAPMACVFGRARVTGQVIWAARFLERRRTTSAGKGGPRTTENDYSLSFAVALCEGPIDGIGRVWADGQPMDLSGVTMRVHRGGPDQAPDSLIEAVEGAAPAYRGVAYVVFEDLSLGPFGNRAPQLSFEVFRRPLGSAPGLEDRLEGVCLIPGAGEFCLADEVVLRRDGLTRVVAENMNNAEGRPDLAVSLDQLEAQCPKLKRVSLVVGWFGDDLRAGHCRVRPGVERRDKLTIPQVWNVAGLDRQAAHLISRSGGSPAYGGTPSDASVRQAIRALKARGWAVTLYPFVFMDVPSDNALPDPYGGARQAAYPWRGRIRGRDGAEAASDVAALFGTAQGWGLRRMALHYARMAAEEGAAGLLIGSEMRGLTWTRDADGGYPAVAQLRALAAECRTVVGPGFDLSYAADWSEYFGHQPQDGSGDVIFHLDPLWADANIDYVGIDWYPPMGDWRAGEGGLDAEAGAAGPADPAYLAGQVAGGEGHDWFYADAEARAAQDRRPILDGAHGEHWVFRPKDLKGWWSNRHHDRPGGVRQVTPTAWTPRLKPIRLTEFGCAAVDRGANAPNLFQDPKSAENALPPHSTGGRDDRMQRRLLDAVLTHYAEPEANPVSQVYGGPMLAGADAWCWDARPYPAFPGRSDVWADAGGWRTGHWLNGRLTGEATAMLEAILRRGGLGEADFVVEPPMVGLAGYVIDRPMRTRDALEPLLEVLGVAAAERSGRVALIADQAETIDLDDGDMTLPEDGSPLRITRRLEAAPSAARVRFIDDETDYQVGTVIVRGEGEGGGVDRDLPIVCGRGTAEAQARKLLRQGGVRETASLSVGPGAVLTLEPGDVVRAPGLEGRWRVQSLDMDETPSLGLAPVEAIEPGWDEGPSSPAAPLTPLGPPWFAVLELPPSESGPRAPLFVAAAEPWGGADLHVGVSADPLRPVASASAPCSVGVLSEALAPGRAGRWDEASALCIRLEGRDPSGAIDALVLGGRNRLAVEVEPGRWEVLAFARAEPMADGAWRLSRLLRGLDGTEVEALAGAAAGSVVVMVDEAVAEAALTRAERDVELLARAVPRGAPPGGVVATATSLRWTGRGLKGWAPARLEVRRGSGGLEASWLARRPGHDGWDEIDPRNVGPWRVTLSNQAGRLDLEVADSGLETVDPWPEQPITVDVCEWVEGVGWGAAAHAAA